MSKGLKQFSAALTGIAMMAGGLTASADIMPKVLYDSEQYVLGLEYDGLSLSGLERINARYGSDGYSTTEKNDIIKGGCSITFAEYNDGRIGAVRNMDLQQSFYCAYELMIHPGENVKYDTWALAYTGVDEKNYEHVLKEGISQNRYEMIPFTSTDAMSFGTNENGERAALYCALLIRGEEKNEDGTYRWACPGTNPGAEIRCCTQSVATMIATQCLTIEDALKLTGAVDESYQKIYPDVQPGLDVYSLNIETETASNHWFEVCAMEDSTGRHGVLEFIDNYPIWHEGINYSFNFFLQDEYLYNPDGTYRSQHGAGIGRYKAVVPYLDKIHTVTDHVALMDGIRYSLMTFYNEENDYIGYDWNNQPVDWRSEKAGTDVWKEYNGYVEQGLDVSAADEKYPLWARYLNTETGKLEIVNSLEAWKENQDHLKPVYDLNYVLSDQNYDEIMNSLKWSGCFFSSLTQDEIRMTNSAWETYFRVVCDPMRFRVTRWFTEDVTTADTICWKTIFGEISEY